MKKSVFLLLLLFSSCLVEPKKAEPDSLNNQIKEPSTMQKEEVISESEISLNLLIKLLKSNRDVFDKWCFQNGFSKVEENAVEVTFTNRESISISKAHFIYFSANDLSIIDKIYNECKNLGFNLINKTESEAFYLNGTLINEAEVTEEYEKNGIGLSFIGKKDHPFSVVVLKNFK